MRRAAREHRRTFGSRQAWRHARTIGRGRRTALVQAEPLELIQWRPPPQTATRCWSGKRRKMAVGPIGSKVSTTTRQGLCSDCASCRSHSLRIRRCRVPVSLESEAENDFRRIGTPGQFAGELLASVRRKSCPCCYKGAGPALNDLIGNHVDFYFPGFPAGRLLI